MGTPTDLTLRARYVFPAESDPIADGWVRIADGRIAEIGRGPRAGIDMGNAAVVPGFVNAHTHLEIDRLPDEFRFDPDRSEPERGADWLRRMIAWRRSAARPPLPSTAAANLRDAVAAGTTSFADVATLGSSFEALVGSPARGVVYSEILGLKRARGLETSEAAFEWLAKVRPRIAENDARVRAGLSPHAPYSTSGWLYQRAICAGLPLTTHLAEFPEELELLRTRGGPMREMLEEIGAWDDGWRALGDRPADYVRKGELKQADWIVAHGSHLEPTDFWQLRPYAAPDGQRVAVAYCPRTHARFSAGRHPYRKMLAQGIIVCVGTDSLATAPDLSMLAELRFLRRRDPEIGGALLLAMGTVFGAWALRLDHVCGSLAPGKAADLAVVALPDREAADPHSLLFEGDGAVRETWIGGERISPSSI